MGENLTEYYDALFQRVLSILKRVPQRSEDKQLWDEVGREVARITGGTFQPAPNPVPEGTPVWEQVVRDMELRNEEGIRKYGVPLTAGDGRNNLQDVYEEELDKIVYLKKYILESKKGE